MNNSSTNIDFILFNDQRLFISNVLGTEAYTCVYQFKSYSKNQLNFYCGLISKKQVKSSLSTFSWDLITIDGFPGCQNDSGKMKNVKYDRFGFAEVEPLIFNRDFTGFREVYPEISEEFRFFHNLYFNDKKNEFVKFDESGNEEVIITYSKDRILIRTKEIREYLGIRNMYLAIFFSHVRYFDIPISEIPTNERNAEVFNKNYCYIYDILEDKLPIGNKFMYVSRLYGKKLIDPYPLSDTSFWPYNEQKKETYDDFIIGIDKNCINILHTCNPDELANYFGKNPNAPHYLTPVFFKREVLQKYYNKSEIFSVQDSYLSCGNMWGLQIDNHQSEIVIVYLGDLGRDLPEKERNYWRHYNILPTGAISPVKFKRDFLCEFAEPEGVDLLFKQVYCQLNIAWNKKYSWPLFREMLEQDSHNFQSLRVLLINSQSEFDNQIQSLAKVLIDSLNEKELTKGINNLPPNSKGITKLELFLNEQKFAKIVQGINILRDIQNIRSTGVAHLKGSKYKNDYIKLQMDKRELKEIFSELLESATSFLTVLCIKVTTI